MSKLRFILMPLVVTAVVVLQMVSPVVARADDGTPPPDQPTEVATDTGTGVTEVVSPTDTATPVPVLDAPATDVPAVEATAHVDASLLSQIPDGTDVVVVNADGSTEPLATQAAADVIASSDPVWCVGSHVPSDDPTGGTYCTPPQATITDLLTTLGANKTTYFGTGTIYFTTNYSTNDVLIDGGDSRVSALQALTIVGNSGLGGPANTLTVPVFVTNWGYAITANSLAIDLSASSIVSTGLDLETSKNIFVGGVFVNGANGNGAFLSADASPSAGVVQVMKSTFTNNTGTGLIVAADNSISVINVTATGNGAGASLDNNCSEWSTPGAACTGSSDVTLSGTNTFDNNHDTGLYVTTGGNIVATSGATSASGNAYGADLTASKSIAITNGTFSDNTYTGLYAQSSAGNVTLSSVTASNNEYGAILGTGTGNVSVSGTSVFDNNTTGIGLQATSDQGSLTLTGVVAYGNDYGAELGAWNGPITITGGSFNDNTTKGLLIESSGGSLNPVNLNGVTATGNGLKGAYIEYVGPCGATTGGVTANVTGGLYQTNGAFGIYALVGPDGNLVLDPTTPPSFGTHNGTPADSLYDTLIDTSVSACPPPSPEPEPGKSYNEVSLPATGGAPVTQDCTGYAGTVLVLPGNDRVTLSCPASGEISLSALTQATLPGSLPAGPIFASALEVLLSEGGQAVNVVTTGGAFTLAFNLPADARAGDHYVILYWDPTANSGAGDWVELPRYEAGLGGSPLVHSLHPGATPDDLMRILSGTRVLGDKVKATVNFPGVFVLVKK